MPDARPGRAAWREAAASGDAARRRARIPYWPDRGGVRAAGRRPTCSLLRNVEGFRFAHPFALALIPPAVALVLWVGLAARRRRGAALFLLLARRGAGRAAAAGWWRACASCRRCCAWRRWCWWSSPLARPQSTRATDDLEVEGIDIVIALDLSGSMQETDLRAQPAGGGQGGDPGLRAPAARPIASAWWSSGARPTPTCRSRSTTARSCACSASCASGIIDGNGTRSATASAWRSTALRASSRRAASQGRSIRAHRRREQRQQHRRPSRRRG